MASFRIKYSMFWAISEPYLLPRTFWAWKKAHFLSILLILNLYSVALCCLNVDLPPPCHKHTSKLSIALSPMSIELLDRFLDQKTWFFVFSKSYARFGAKGLSLQQQKKWNSCFLRFLKLAKTEIHVFRGFWACKKNEIHVFWGFLGLQKMSHVFYN